METYDWHRRPLLDNTGLADPGSSVRGANMGPIWGRQDPGGPHVGPMNVAIWGALKRPYILYEFNIRVRLLVLYPFAH